MKPLWKPNCALQDKYMTEKTKICSRYIVEAFMGCKLHLRTFEGQDCGRWDPASIYSLLRIIYPCYVFTVICIWVAKRRSILSIQTIVTLICMQTEEFKGWFEESKHWLKPYAVFCFLRDLFGTSEHWRWGLFSEPSEKVCKPASSQYILPEEASQCQDMTNYCSLITLNMISVVSAALDNIDVSLPALTNKALKAPIVLMKATDLR